MPYRNAQTFFALLLDFGKTLFPAGSAILTCICTKLYQSRKSPKIPSISSGLYCLAPKKPLLSNAAANFSSIRSIRPSARRNFRIEKKSGNLRRQPLSLVLPDII